MKISPTPTIIRAVGIPGLDHANDHFQTVSAPEASGPFKSLALVYTGKRAISANRSEGQFSTGSTMGRVEVALRRRSTRSGLFLLLCENGSVSLPSVVSCLSRCKIMTCSFVMSGCTKETRTGFQFGKFGQKARGNGERA